MNAVLKSILITAAAVVPMTYVLNVTDASNAVIAPVVILVLGACSMLAVKLYRESNPS